MTDIFRKQFIGFDLTQNDQTACLTFHVMKGSRSGMGGYELLDQLSEPFFRPAGGYVANFSRSVDSNSEEIYSQQALYSSYTSGQFKKRLFAEMDSCEERTTAEDLL